MNLAQTLQVYESQLYCFIRKEGDQHCVKSHSGKNLGCYRTASGARKRLKQVEYFKNVKADTYWGPNTGGMGPSKALGDPE